MKQLIQKSLQEGIDLRTACLELAPVIEQAGLELIRALASGHKVMFCGNGGSAADSQHLAAELVGRFEVDNQLSALALTTDSSILTALGNDFGFREVYSRQVRALGQAGDCLVAISTSGNSSNIVAAVKAAHELGMRSVGLSGGQGGELLRLCHSTVVVPSQRTCRIQEIHLSVGHIWCEMIEEARRQGQIG